MSKLHYKLWYIKDMREGYKKYWDLCFKKVIDTVDKKDYNMVYKDTILYTNPSDMILLEELFEKFNINHPDDFNNRSLSTCDVVEIQREDNNSHFYICCSIGWKEITFHE